MAAPGTTDMDHAQVTQAMKDDDLCKQIVEVLGRDGPQRVLLAGEAGIGKTRLAKKVAERATDHRLCFLTLCLHLNKKFEDEWSLYENIASQLSVYSDFEETEVDDRDEDDEEDKKTTKELLDELKKKITDEIEIQRKVAEKKAKNLAEKKAKELAVKKRLGDGENQTGDGKEKPTGAETKPAEGEKGEPYLLLILDDDGNKTSEDKVMKELELEKFLKKQDFLKDQNNRLKIIVTRRKGDEEPAGEIVPQHTKSEQGGGSHSTEEQKAGNNDSGNVSDGEIKPHVNDNEGETKPPATDNAQAADPSGEITPATADESKAATKCYDEIKFNTTDKSHVLLESINEEYLTKLFASLMNEEWMTKELISKMVTKSKNSPAAIVVFAKSLKRITPSTSGPEKKESEAKIINKIQEVLSADRSASSDQGSSSESAINPILYLAYELLKTSFPLKDAILDCFWHSLDFFEHCGCVYYRDLITQWILEGYFDPVKYVEKAYQDGHTILMELINRGMLKIQENNVVVPEMAMSNLIDPRRRGHLGRSQLGFSRVYAGDKKKGIGKITQLDDMIKTVQAKKGDKVSTILVSGDRLRRETPEKYFKKLVDLEVLGLFEPTLEPFVPTFSKLHKLRVLVIRDCDLLTDIEELKALRELNALEVSGASSLKKISDDFFKALSKLQSLHLSGLRITSSPSSISELTELHCLIIRDCPLLEDLPDIQELVKLEVVDISGARGLQTCFDNTKGEKKNKSKNKNFYHLTKLQLLDFSESQIERLPIFQDSAVPDKLKSLTRLLLRNCSKLRRLPSLKPLSGLQILDLSGTTSLVEMLEVCFEDKKELKTLNLTGTNLSELATTIEELSNLNELLLKDCTNLEALPDITKLTNLEVIDVSGCTKLQKIEGSFEKMSYLRDVNLFGSKVMITPEFLPKESKIRCLKRITLSDKTYFEKENWSEIKETMKNEISNKASSSDEVVKSQEIVEKKPEEIGEIQPNEPCATDCTEKGDVSKERLLQVPIDRSLYKKTLPFFDFASQQEVMKIHASKDLPGEALANADFVSFVDISSTRLTSICNETKTVKSCSVRMCMDLKDLFSGVDEANLGSLETLSITNLPLLETICWGGSFKNLKNLTIECCPNIKTLFLEASQMPSSLEILHIKFCEGLEKVFREEGEVPNLTTLCLVGLPVLSAVGAKLPNLKTLDKRNCPKLLAEMEDLKGSGWVLVDPSDVPPQD